MEGLKRLIRDLVLFKSYSPEECNRLIDFIRQCLDSHRVPSELLENERQKILVATIGQGKNCLILNAHIDVVQNDPDRFSLREEGDRLIGPGVVDMKASVAVLMELLTEIDPKKLHARIMVQFVPDEETGGRKGTGFLVEKGYLGDFIVCCEPTNLKISVQSKGALFAKINVTGKAAHGSRPWLGDNAILKGIRMVDELQKLPFVSGSSRYFHTASVNLTRINGGDSLNKVPDHCELYLDIRHLPEQPLPEVKRQISSVTNRYPAKIEFIKHSAPVVTPEDHPAVRELLSICQRRHPESVLFGQDGSSDAKFYAPLDVPGIEFGPAGGGQHSTEEYVEYSKLLLYKELLKEFILEYGKGQSPKGY